MAATETYTPRLKQRYNDELRAALHEQLELASIMQSPDDRQDHAEHGRRRGQDRREADRRRSRGADDHRRPARAGAPRAQVDRPVQDPRRDAHRRARHAARRPHVGVPRSARVDRAARASATSAASTPTRSTGAATTRSGIREQIIFPEIDYDSINQIRGLDVAITTTATNGRRRRACFSRRSACRSQPTEGTASGQDVAESQGRAAGEVQGAELHAAATVRASARRVQEVRALPYLPAGAGPSGRDPRHDEEFLVGGQSAHRSCRRHAHAHPQRQQGAARQRRDAELEAEGRDRPHPQGGGVHPRLPRRGRKARIRRSSSS